MPKPPPQKLADGTHLYRARDGFTYKVEVKTGAIYFVDGTGWTSKMVVEEAEYATSNMEKIDANQT
jgi:hypothetical protein